MPIHAPIPVKTCRPVNTKTCRRVHKQRGRQHPDAFAVLRSSCRSACRSIPCPARDSRATENTRRRFRPWTRRRGCGGCGGCKGSGPPDAHADLRARVPLPNRGANLVTESDGLIGAGCRGFAPCRFCAGDVALMGMLSVVQMTLLCVRPSGFGAGRRGPPPMRLWAANDGCPGYFPVIAPCMD